jgi:lysozyme
VIAVPYEAVELAKRFEGFHRVPRSDPSRAHPYICPAGYWTIGYGRLCKPDHPPITEAEAETYLAEDLQTALRATLRYCPLLSTEDSGKLAAIVDFTFNLGAGRLQTSTLRRRINERNWGETCVELRRWVHGGGRMLPGLIARRELEAQMIQMRKPSRWILADHKTSKA